MKNIDICWQQKVDKMVDISIIVPSYNRVHTIETSIESLLNQNYSGTYEIIISDDGSTDGTVELVKEKFGERVRLLQKKEECPDQGAASARNRGLMIAEGRYISFLDSDDVYMPDFLKTMSTTLDADDKLGYVFCRVLKSVRMYDGDHISSWTREKMCVLDCKYHVLHRAYCICTIGIMCRKSVIDKVGFFDASLAVGEDSDMWIRISEASIGRFIEYPGAIYRIDGYADNQLSKLPVSRRSYDGKKVYEMALARYDKAETKDILRLFLVLKGIYASDFQYIRNSVCRNLRVMTKLFFKMPFMSVRYLILRNRV